MAIENVVDGGYIETPKDTEFIWANVNRVTNRDGSLAHLSADLRIYVESEGYTGYTKQGFKFDSPKALQDFIDLAVGLQSAYLKALADEKKEPRTAGGKRIPKGPNKTGASPDTAVPTNPTTTRARAAAVAGAKGLNEVAAKQAAPRRTKIAPKVEEVEVVVEEETVTKPAAVVRTARKGARRRA